MLPGGAADAAEAVRAAGLYARSAAHWADLDGSSRPVAVMLELEALADAAVTELLDGAFAWAESLGARLIVSFGPEQVDAVAGALLGAGAQLLSAPAPSDRVAAIAIARGARPRVGEPSDETAARLLRLAEEVARIAEALGGLARDEAAAAGDRRSGYAAEDDGERPTPARVRGAIRARRLRDAEFGPGLFEEPAWDMLLDLFAADLEDVRVSVSSLCIASAVAQTTALRWIGRMVAAELVERREDPTDRRRVFISLSGRAGAGMRRWFAAVRRAGLTT